MPFFSKSYFWKALALLSLIYLVVDYTIYEIKASENIANCQRLQLEMTVEEVIDIMGKPESTRKLKKPIGLNYIEVNKYHYSTTLGASTGGDIYFSLETDLVLKVDCQ